VRHAWRLGGGHGPTNHLAPLIAPGNGWTLGMKPDEGRER
jgi:hypothetical protein